MGEWEGRGRGLEKNQAPICTCKYFEDDCMSPYSYPVNTLNAWINKWLNELYFQ